MPCVPVSQDVFHAASIDNGNVAMCHLLSQVLKWDVRLQRLCLLAAFFIAPSVENYHLIKEAYSQSVPSAANARLSSYQQCHLSQCLRYFIPEDIPLSARWVNISRIFVRYLHRSKVVNTTWRLPDGKLQTLRVHLKSWSPDEEITNLLSVKDFRASCNRALEGCKRGTKLVSVRQEVQRLPDSEKLVVCPKQSKTESPTMDALLQNTTFEASKGPATSLPESLPVYHEGGSSDNTKDFLADSMESIINDESMECAQALLEYSHNWTSTPETSHLPNESSGGIIHRPQLEGQQSSENLVDESVDLSSCQVKDSNEQEKQSLSKDELVLASGPENIDRESVQCRGHRTDEDSSGSSERADASRKHRDGFAFIGKCVEGNSRQTSRPFHLKINTQNKAKKCQQSTDEGDKSLPVGMGREADVMTPMEETILIHEGQEKCADENTDKVNQSETLILDRVMGNNCVMDGDRKGFPGWSCSLQHSGKEGPDNHQSKDEVHKEQNGGDMKIKMATKMEMSPDFENGCESCKDMESDLHLSDVTRENGTRCCRAHSTLIVVTSKKVYDCSPEEIRPVEGREGNLVTSEGTERDGDFTQKKTDDSAEQNADVPASKDSEVMVLENLTDTGKSEPMCCSPHRLTDERDGDIKQIETEISSNQNEEDIGNIDSVVLISETTTEEVKNEPPCYSTHRPTSEKDDDIKHSEIEVSSVQNRMET